MIPFSWKEFQAENGEVPGSVKSAGKARNAEGDLSWRDAPRTKRIVRRRSRRKALSQGRKQVCQAMLYALMDNRSGLVGEACLTRADGHGQGSSCRRVGGARNSS